MKLGHNYDKTIDIDLFRLWRPIGPICRSILVSQIRAQ